MGKSHPIYNEKALILGNNLIISDLHIGIEDLLSKNGVKVPSQTEKMKEKILGLIEKEDPDRLVILGDLKHNIPKTSWQEYMEIPKLIDSIPKDLEVVIIKGNHDGNIERLLPNTKIVKSIVLEDAILLHGHSWPDKDDRAKFVVMGHNHPCIQFEDQFGHKSRENAWIRARFKKGFERSREVIIMPAFNDLLSGTPFNAVNSKHLLGPFFKSDMIDVKNAEAYLLDGTCLGKIKDLATHT